MNDLADRSARGLSTTEVKFEGNTSGWSAVDYKCFVRKDKVEEKTVGGIVVPKSIQDQEEWSVDRGILVSHGHLAFTSGRRANGETYHWSPCPKVGDRVMVREHTGMRFKGDDGESYLIYTDKDIVGLANE